jgi:hypothetical protein
MNIAPLVRPTLTMPLAAAGMVSSVSVAAPQPVEPRAVMKQVLSSAFDAIAAACVATITTDRFDSTLPYWVTRASRLGGEARGSLEAAAAMAQLVPELRVSTDIVIRVLATAQHHISDAVDAAVGSQERRKAVERAHHHFEIAQSQLRWVIQQNWPA